MTQSAFAGPGVLQSPGSWPPVSAETFRQTLARHPAGVAIVTLAGPGGPAGLTVTSFSSASLEPPLVSFYIGHGSSSWPHIRVTRHFAVNLIGAGQEALAARFARKAEDRFAPPTRWRTGTAGLPLLVDATTHLVCTIHQQVTVGDHELVVGRLVEVAIGQGGDDPLIHHQGQFGNGSPGNWTR
jgi:flavin reductase (DIM6/NTAB) family NADH-FMN oxidoreductase RutF